MSQFNTLTIRKRDPLGSFHGKNMVVELDGIELYGVSRVLFVAAGDRFPKVRIDMYSDVKIKENGLNIDVDILGKENLSK